LFRDADGNDNIVGTEDDDLRLLAGSPCIDAGDNTAISEVTDLDGKPRFVQDPLTTDTGNGTPPIIDMGAYEYNADVIFVDADAPGANDGSSWENAYNYVQDALAEANSNPGVNQIWVAEGTYKPDANTANPAGTGERTATFQLISRVEIYGGFAGYWAADPNERDIEVYETILSGDIDTPGDNSDNSYHVVTGSGADANAVLDGFTITAGNADGYGACPGCTDHGGGMFNWCSSPMVTNCTFIGNSAKFGGGIFNGSYSSPQVTNCTFCGNVAEGTSYSSDSGGAGMANDDHSSPHLTNCSFSGNRSISGSGKAWGGGLANWSYCDPNLINCTFTGNWALSGSGDAWGGGMNNHESSPILTNCRFNGNDANDGGGMFNDSGEPDLTNCTFSGNVADANGGGMDNYRGSRPTLKNCTFSGNSAAYGGGMCNYINSSSMVVNCIIWANTAPSGAQIYNDGTSSATVSYSDVEGGWPGTENIDEDPVFIDSNGLDGIPGTGDDEEGYVHLRGYSPCINAGDPNGDYSGQVDIDNQPRVAYGRVDMGADEVFPVAGDFEPDGDVDFADFARIAQNWLLGAE
jgi:parallel beta-helix repeat protein